MAPTDQGELITQRKATARQQPFTIAKERSP